ncbi:arginase RocF [Rubrivivax gelatinosus IL144]|uniref:Arginase RocF n=2 Tax=Rubrivivax gelatinosus TaxID=28068 RepID=I0HQW4_RUBGI|nr:arginase RocF [Rubrivivax gelatinosus IL144]
MTFELTVFQGRVGDHNDLAIPGARRLAEAMGRLLALEPTVVGVPRPALDLNWDVELESARPELLQLQARFEDVYVRGGRPLSATSRCAASVATLPVVARHHPEACVVWFDAHADLNTPQSTRSGYLGGLALSASLGLWDSGFGSGLALTNVVLVGQRDLDPFEIELMRAHCLPHVQPGAGLADRLRAAIAGRPVYVHLDCDVLNPGIVPTDYAHEGGLSLDDLRQAMAVIAEQPVVGVEVAEYQDAWAAGEPPVSPLPLLAALAPVLGLP